MSAQSGGNNQPGNRPDPDDAGHDAASGGRQRFEQAAAAILRASAVDVDATTQARLQQVRRTALAALPRGRSLIGTWKSAIGAPAFGLAAVAVFAVALWLGAGPGSMELVPDAPAPALAVATPEVSSGDADFLMTDTSMEMIQDLEFFAWLDADRSDAELRAELDAVGSPGA